MSAIDFFDAIKSAFCAYGCPVPIYIGKHFLSQHREPTSIVLWQGADKFTPPLPSVPINTTGYSKQGINPRSVKTRVCGLTANIWASAPEQSNAERQYRADLALLDVIINQAVVVLQQISSGIHVVEGGISSDANADSVRSGLVYELQFDVETPIVDMPWATMINACSKTWTEAPATAEITIAGAVDPSTTPPSYQDAVTYSVAPVFGALTEAFGPLS